MLTEGKSPQKGFTLVELLISLALGVIISFAAIELYVESKRSYMQDEEMARLQENARFSVDYLKRELTLSGFFGGINDTSSLAPQPVTSDCSGAAWALDVTTPFELVNDNNGTSLSTVNGTTWSCITPGDVVAGTDLFSVKRTSDSPTLRNGELTGDGEDLNQWYFKTFDYSDLSWTYLNANISSHEKTSGSTYNYWEYYAKIFYIRSYAVTEDDGIPTLCVNTLTGSAMTNQCLVEGVQDIQIELGIDADNDGVVEQYKNAPAAVDFGNARSVRLYMLVRSVNPIPGYKNEKTYRLGQKDIAAFNDAFVRKVISTTIKLRNVSLG